jgi:hypothetical protein
MGLFLDSHLERSNLTMTSEKQRLANQENAAKSTGPRTEEGKERSRRNALKHGRAGAGKVLRRKDDRRLAKKLAAWREHLQPVDVLEDAIVTRVAIASVRLESCVKFDLAQIARRRRRAWVRWEQRQRQAVDLFSGRLDDDPAHAVERLETLSLGCDWLAAHWKMLADTLTNAGCWSRAHVEFAIRLLGKDPDNLSPDDSSLAKLRLAFYASSPELDADELDAFFETSTAELDAETRQQTLAARLPDPETGRAMLSELIADEIERLETLSAELWEEQDAPMRQEAEDLSLVDTSAAGAQASRYETACELSFHRNLNQIIRLRKIEPEHQTLSRWSKRGVTHGRIWRGTGWEYVRADGTTADFADPESPAIGSIEPDQASCEDARFGTNTDDISRFIQTKIEHPQEPANTAETPEPAEVATQGSTPTEPQRESEAAAPNEAISPASNREGETTCAESELGSPMVIRTVTAAFPGGGFGALEEVEQPTGDWTDPLGSLGGGHTTKAQREDTIKIGGTTEAQRTQR